MEIIKRLFIFALALIILGFLFTAGLVFLIAALVLVPIFYLIGRKKGKDFLKRKQEEQQQNECTIDVEYEVVEAENDENKK